MCGGRRAGHTLTPPHLPTRLTSSRRPQRRARPARLNSASRRVELIPNWGRRLTDRRLCAFDVPSKFFFFLFIYLTVYFKCQSWGAAVWDGTCHGAIPSLVPELTPLAASLSLPHDITALIMGDNLA